MQVPKRCSKVSPNVANPPLILIVCTISLKEDRRGKMQIAVQAWKGKASIQSKGWNLVFEGFLEGPERLKQFGMFCFRKTLIFGWVWNVLFQKDTHIWVNVVYMIRGQRLRGRLGMLWVLLYNQTETWIQSTRETWNDRLYIKPTEWVISDAGNWLAEISLPSNPRLEGTNYRTPTPKIRCRIKYNPPNIVGLHSIPATCKLLDWGSTAASGKVDPTFMCVHTPHES
jgi:hypothetical protein